MFHRIMVPLDASSAAETALPAAAALARRDGATLHLVLVHRTAEPHTPLEQLRWRREQAYCDRHLEDLRRKLTDEGASVVTATLDGNVPDALAGYVTRQQIDLVVMASHGRTGLRRLFAGSVGDELARTVSVPLLMLRSAAHPAAPPTAVFHRILVALDGAAASEAALGVAQEIAAPGSSTLVLGRAVPAVPVEIDIAQVPGAVLEDVEATEQVMADARRYLDGVAAALRSRTTCPVEVGLELAPVIFPVTPIAPAVSSLAKRVRADLVVLTTRERGWSRLLLASVADRVLHDTDAALLVCHAAH